MKKALKLIIALPLIIILSVAQVLLTVFSMLGFALTIVISFLMYIALAMILLFELQPVNEIAFMSLVAAGILISPMVIVGGTALTAGLKQLLILWIE